MRPCLQRDWKSAASSGEEKTRTGSRGAREMNALMMAGGDIVVVGNLEMLGLIYIQGIPYTYYSFSESSPPKVNSCFVLLSRAFW
jgi:hypothetical protein